MIFIATVATRGRLKNVPAARKKSTQKSIDNVAVRKKPIQKSIDNVAVRKVARFRMVVYRQTAPGQKWLLLPITTCFGLRVVWIQETQIVQCTPTTHYNLLWCALSAHLIYNKYT